MSLCNYELVGNFPFPSNSPLDFRNDEVGLNFRDKSVPWCGGKTAESGTAGSGCHQGATECQADKILSKVESKIGDCAFATGWTVPSERVRPRMCWTPATGSGALAPPFRHPDNTAARTRLSSEPIHPGRPP